MNFPEGKGNKTHQKTLKKILGSLQPNLMTKFKVIDKKPSKNGHTARPS